MNVWRRAFCQSLPPVELAQVGPMPGRWHGRHPWVIPGSGGSVGAVGSGDGVMNESFPVRPVIVGKGIQPAAVAARAGTIEQQVLARIESMSCLPITAAVAMKFMELGKDPQAGSSEYSKVISSDSSLSTKMLSMANSSWFGIRNKVTKVQVAVNLLGLGTVRTLAISYCLTGLHNELRLTADESSMFWMASLYKAVAARML